ncbi:MAG: hypothetical protein ACYC24_01845 [Desulfobacteria bacterium]
MSTPVGGVYSCRDEDGKGIVTLDRKLRVRVRELCYPGDRSKGVTGKWIYVIRGGVHVAEIHAIAPDEWMHLENPSPDQPNEKRKLTVPTKGYIPLDPGSPGAPHTYRFFLTPVRLTPEAMKYILGHSGHQCGDLVGESFRMAEETVEIPDPHCWAEEAHSTYYMPALDEYITWKLDNPEREASLFIASVFDGWIKAGDEVGIGNELQEGQPGRFIDEYKDQEKPRRERAEKAMAYLAHWIDSAEHFAVELAGMQTGGEDLEKIYLHWATVSGNLLETVPGRVFASYIVGDENRFIRKFVFSEKPDPKQLEFEDQRQAWLAALATFENLIPAMCSQFGKPSGPKAPALDVIRKYLENLNVKGLTGNKKKIYRNIVKGKPLQTGFLKGKQMQRFKREYKELVVDASAWEEMNRPPTRMEKAGKKIEAIAEHADFQATIKITIASGIEVANFCIAYMQYREASPEEKSGWWGAPSKLRPLVGSTADLAGHFHGLLEKKIARTIDTKVASILGKKVLSRSVTAFGGAANVVSGICDMIDYEERAAGAAYQKDYGQEVGQTIAYVGSATVALGGAMVIASAFAKGAVVAGVAAEASAPAAGLGPAGLIVVAVGTVLAGGGAVLAVLLFHNPYEGFANMCIFGKERMKEEVVDVVSLGGDMEPITEERLKTQRELDTVYYPWASRGLGSGNAVAEAQILLELLANFSVERIDMLQTSETRLTVRPGYLADDSVLELEVHDSWYSGIPDTKKGKGGGLRSRYAFDLAAEEVYRVEGDHEHKVSLEIRREKEEIKEIHIAMGDATYPGGDFSGHIETARIRLNLFGNGRAWVPPNMDWIQVPRHTGHGVTQTGSLDVSNRVDTNGKKFEG